MGWISAGEAGLELSDSQSLAGVSVCRDVCCFAEPILPVSLVGLSAELPPKEGRGPVDLATVRRGIP